MQGKLTKKDIIKIILDDTRADLGDEEITHLLIDEKISKNVYKESLSFGDKMADKVAATAGSWMFIISFCFILVFWIIANVVLLAHSFDPYPFILLNLVLSCVAALQAPVIMMSQNRQELKDRLQAKNDYKVNLKSEIIIEDLHKKIDQIMATQQKVLNYIEKLEKTDLNN